MKTKAPKITVVADDLKLFPLHKIVVLMQACDPVHFSRFAPYYTPFRAMDTAADQYGADSGSSVVLYALGNWSTCRSKDMMPWGDAPMVPTRSVVTALLKAHLKAVQSR